MWTCSVLRTNRARRMCQNVCHSRAQRAVYTWSAVYKAITWSARQLARDAFTIWRHRIQEYWALSGSEADVCEKHIHMVQTHQQAHALAWWARFSVRSKSNCVRCLNSPKAHALAWWATFSVRPQSNSSHCLNKQSLLRRRITLWSAWAAERRRRQHNESVLSSRVCENTIMRGLRLWHEFADKQSCQHESMHVAETAASVITTTSQWVQAQRACNQWASWTRDHKQGRMARTGLCESSMVNDSKTSVGGKFEVQAECSAYVDESSVASWTNNCFKGYLAGVGRQRCSSALSFWLHVSRSRRQQQNLLTSCNASCLSREKETRCGKHSRHEHPHKRRTAKQLEEQACACDLSAVTTALASFQGYSRADQHSRVPVRHCLSSSSSASSLPSSMSQASTARYSSCPPRRCTDERGHRRSPACSPHVDRTSRHIFRAGSPGPQISTFDGVNRVIRTGGPFDAALETEDAMWCTVTRATRFNQMPYKGNMHPGGIGNGDATNMNSTSDKWMFDGRSQSSAMSRHSPAILRTHCPTVAHKNAKHEAPAPILRWLRWTIALWLNAVVALPWLQWSFSLWRGIALRAELCRLRWWSVAMWYGALMQGRSRRSRRLFMAWHNLVLQKQAAQIGQCQPNAEAHHTLLLSPALREQPVLRLSWRSIACLLTIFVAWSSMTKRAFALDQATMCSTSFESEMLLCTFSAWVMQICRRRRPKLSHGGCAPQASTNSIHSGVVARPPIASY